MEQMTSQPTTPASGLAHGRRQSRPGKKPSASPTRDRPNVRGDETRELILVTAERLFAERGIAAVPLREIAIPAGQKNKVAFPYQSGDRDARVTEVAARRLEFVEELRVELLAEIGSSSGQPEVRQFVRSFVLSLASNLVEHNHYLAFLARYIVERGGYWGLADAVSSGTVVTLRKILNRLLPDLREGVIEERWEILMESAIHALARYQTKLESDSLPAPLEDLLDDLIRFLTAGLMAPCSTSAQPGS